MQTVGTKRCTKCGERRTLSSFNRMTVSPDGLQYNCKSCNRKYNALQYAKKKTYIKARNKAYRVANQKTVSAFKRRYYEAHRENYRHDLRRWRREHWDYHYINHQAKRRSLIRGATLSDFTLEDWIELLEQYGYQCAYCKSTSKLTMDHIVPLSKGGQHTQRNIAPACGPCNSRKGATLL